MLQRAKVFFLSYITLPISLTQSINTLFLFYKNYFIRIHGSFLLNIKEQIKNNAGLSSKKLLQTNETESISYWKKNKKLNYELILNNEILVILKYLYAKLLLFRSYEVLLRLPRQLSNSLAIVQFENLAFSLVQFYVRSSKIAIV